MDSLYDQMGVNVSDIDTTLCKEPPWGYSYQASQIIGGCLTALPIIALGLNLTAMVVIFRAPKLKPCTRLFLFSVAICDTFVAIFIMPFRLVGLLGDRTLVHYVTLCNIGNGLDLMLYISSISNLCILTFDRFLALCKPFRHAFWFKKEHCVLMFILSWLVPASLAFGIVPVQLHTKGVLPQNRCIMKITGSCQFLSNVPYALSSTSLCYVIPCAFILICNYFILAAIDKRKKIFLTLLRLHTERGSCHRRHFGTRLAFTTMKMTSCFVLCWLPFYVVQSVQLLTSYQVPHYVWLLAYWAGYANCAINPLIYLRSISFIRFRCMENI